MSYRALLILPFIFFCLSFQTKGQAWVRQKGAGYFQIGYSNLQFNSLHARGKTPKINLPRSISDQTIQGYIEVGLGKNWMISAEVPFKMTSSKKINPESDFQTMLPASHLNAFGNMHMAIIYGFNQGESWVSSVKLRLEEKTASYDHDSGLRTGFDSWGIAPSFCLGHGEQKFFVSGETGFQIRSDQYSSQFFAQVQGGLHLAKQKLLLMLVLDCLQSLENGDFNDQNSQFSGLYPNDISYLASTLKISAKPTDQIRLWAAVGGGVGNLVARTPSFSFTISYEWNAKK